jgi:hypothetical protein
MQPIGSLRLPIFLTICILHSQINPVHILLSYFFKIHVILPLVICIYCQRQQFIVFNNAQQCYMFRPKRPSSGIDVHGLKTSEMS